MKTLTYKHTVAASFIGYLVLSITGVFVPLLFVTFQNDYGLTLEKTTLLVTLNFTTQVIFDLIAPKLIKLMGIRRCCIVSHFVTAAGLMLLSVLPELFSDKFIGIAVCVFLYAAGVASVEIIVNIVVESCPSDSTAGALSFLHSGYCWGSVLVVLVSTLFFQLFGTGSWRILAIIWGIIPILNALFFTKVPIDELDKAEVPANKLIKMKTFWVMLVLVVLSAASEQAVEQWVSTFAEASLNVSKSTGDLAGILMFSVMMGVARLLFAKFSVKLELKTTMAASLILCIISYLIITLSPSAVLSLIGCAVCGLSVGILMPGAYGLSVGSLKGGEVLFALMALSSDLGGTVGSNAVGTASSFFDGDLKKGILCATVFPAAMLVILVVMKCRGSERAKRA